MKKVWEFIKKHKKLIIILAIVAVLIAGGIYIASAVKKAQGLFAGMGNSATTEVIERRDIVNSITATGTIVAVEERSVSASVTGVNVVELNVEVGDYVNAGDVICVLDEEAFQEQLADAKTNRNADAGRSGLDVSSSKRSLNDALTEQAIDNARADEDAKAAYNTFSSAADDCQEAQDKLEQASGELKSAKNKMDAAKQKYESAKSAKAGTADLSLQEAAVMSAANEYNSTATAVENYVSGKGGTGTLERLDTSADFAILMGSQGSISANAIKVASDMIVTDDAEIRSEVEARLAELSVKADAFNAALSNYSSAASAGMNAKEAAIAKAETEYSQAKLEYESAKAKEDSMRTAYDSHVKNVESLYDAYNKTLRNIDDIKRNNDIAIASRQDGLKSSNINASVATLADDRNIKQIEEQIEGCTVTASIGGVVTAVNVVKDEMYAGGAIVVIENTSDYEVSALIDEYDIAKVKVDQEVIIKTNGTGTTEMKGKVKFIAPHATTAPGVSGVKYEVIISVLDKNEDLRLDMTAKVEIICEKAANVLSVATEAIQEDDDGNYYVEVLDSGSTIDTSALMTNPGEFSEEDVEKLQSGEKTYESHNVTVTKGLAGDYYTEISGEGLEKGTKVVIPNEGALADINEYMEQAGAAGGY